MKSIKIVAACLVLLVSPWAAAEKIAVLGVEQALLASQAAQNFKKTLDKDLKADQQQLAELEKQAKALQDKIKDKGAQMSKETLQQTRLQFQKAFEAYQRTGQEMQQKRLEREQAFLQEMQPKLDEVVRGLIDKNKYDVVISKQATVYAAKGVDITATVVDLLNKK